MACCRSQSELVGDPGPDLWSLESVRCSFPRTQLLECPLSALVSQYGVRVMCTQGSGRLSVSYTYDRSPAPTVVSGIWQVISKYSLSAYIIVSSSDLLY